MASLDDIGQLADAVAILRRLDNPRFVEIADELARLVTVETPADRLGSEGRGGTSPRYARKLVERNKILRRLHRLLWPELTPGAAAHIIATAFYRYRSIRWPRERDAAAPAGEPALTFWRLLQFDMRMPGMRRLAQILADEIQSL